MIGQGRPKASRWRSVFVAGLFAACAKLCAAALVLSSIAAAGAAEPTMRVRVAWGGGTEQRWEVSIRATEGALANPTPLGIEADEPGSAWEQSGKIAVRARSRRTYDAVEFEVHAPISARLAVEVKAADEPKADLVEIPLEHLVSGMHTSSLTAGGNRLLVTRSPGDALRLELGRDHLVFAPREPLVFHVRPHLVGGAERAPVRLQAELLEAGTGQRVWSQDVQVTATDETEHNRATFQLAMPDHEGVFNLKLSAVGGAAGRFGKRLALRWNKPLVERSVQLMVLGSQPQPLKPQTAPSTLLEIDPSSPRWYERLAHIPLIPGQRRGPLGSGDAARWDHPKLGSMVQLSPAADAGAASWESYPLPISQPGMVYTLEVEYPSDVPQTIGISLLEPNAAGAVTPIGLDSGVFVPDEDADNPAQLLKHRLVFWPRTKSPLLLITNRRKGARAVYGKIRVLGGGKSSFVGLPLGRAPSAPALPKALPPGPQTTQRLIAGYMDRPLFPENFGAAESLDSWSKRSLDDWTTFYQGGTRLVEYLSYAGYNGLMLAVLADGSTIYPSRYLQPTPRYDTGVFFSSGQDPMRKDALEMLFRLFDREQLVLIPSLQLAAPLPELEMLKRRGGPQAEGIELIGADGKTWTDHNAPRDGLAPYYNPLNPQVQQAIVQVVRELVTRYAKHPSFGGVSIELEGYAHLAWGDWGYDDATIARFERDVQIDLRDVGPDRFLERARRLGTGARAAGQGRADVRQAWLAWRASELARFHRRLEQELAALHGGARLYLSGTTTLDVQQAQRSLRPSLPPQLRMSDALLELGLNPSAHEQSRRIALLRPHRVAPVGPLSAEAVNLEINSAPDVDRLYPNGPHGGTLFYHVPQKTFLPSFDAKSPFGTAKTLTWLVSQMSPAGGQNRKRFAHALAASDLLTMFDGGWLLPLGQEEAVRDLFVAYRQLPGVRFVPVPGEHQPVAIRTAAHAGQTYFYFVNDSAWEATATLDLDLPVGTSMEKLGTGRGIQPIAWKPQGASWTVRLAPYQMVAARLATPVVRVIQARAGVPEAVRLALGRRIQDLGMRARALSHPQPLLTNASFETEGKEGAIPAWEIPEPAPGAVAVETQFAHTGRRSLKLSSTGKSTVIRSAAVENSRTGRLSLLVWLRAGEVPKPPTLRLAIEGKSESGLYERYGNIGPATPSRPLGSQWSRYVLEFDDVPLEGLSDLRVRMDLLGPGEIWIDDVELYDLIFSPNERIELTKIITLAYSQLQEGRLSDCARLLDSYWGQFLVTNVPLTQAPVSVAERPKAPIAEPPPADAPGMLDRVKDLVPKFMRF